MSAYRPGSTESILVREAAASVTLAMLVKLKSNRNVDGHQPLKKFLLGTVLCHYQGHVSTEHTLSLRVAAVKQDFNYRYNKLLDRGLDRCTPTDFDTTNHGFLALSLIIVHALLRLTLLIRSHASYKAID